MNFYYALISHWIVLLLVYPCSRIAFLASNFQSFPSFSYWDFIEGIRFDLSALAYINAIYFLLLSIPPNNKKRSAYYLVRKYFFIMTNSLFVILNNIDIVYFKFNLRRSSNEIFNLLENSQDILVLIPKFIVYYWPVTLLTIVQLWLLLRSTPSISMPPPKNLIFNVFRILTIIGSSILFARGGIQLKPIKPINAGEVFQSLNSALVLNTQFYLIHTFNKNELEKISEFSKSEINSAFNTTKHYNKNSIGDLNVVIIIVESLSKEFVGHYNNGKGYTPFLDNLMKNSLVFENAFANGLRSIDAVPAIISSVPSLMNDPYINSKYANNNVPSLSSILNKEGYESSFFHGGRRGTMGFLGYCNQVKFDQYIGMEDFPEQKYFDGNWGIYDEPFLIFSANELIKAKKPIFSTIFTLSSHPPFNLPKKFANTFPKGENKIHELIGYSDYSLKMFFNKIKNENWFKKTLFVITADHTSSDTLNSKSNGYLNRHKIPLFFYLGDNSLKGNQYNITQQIDIMPTILDLIGYDKKFFSFGKSALRKESWAVIGNDQEKFLLTENGILHKNIAKFKCYKDHQLKETTNINPKDTIKLRAIEQSFNNRMINNHFETERLPSKLIHN